VIVASGLGLAAALLSGYWFHATRPVTGRRNVVFGRLPAGVSRDDLNLLLITLDTTRADRLRSYGFQGVETPNLDRLAREGVLFEQASSAAPLTLPAHATLFTSRFPPEHGMRDNGGFFLDDSQVTLAETLKARGFSTGGFVGAYVLDSKWGLGQGFDTYYDNFDLSKYQSISLGGVERRGGEVVDHALEWLASIGDRRFFAWTHFYDPHSPYDPPEPYRTTYGNHPYAGEIAYTDAQVGRLLAYLERQDLLDRTIVVAIGDHGESLGEHGEGTHGFFIYEGVLHVPLIIRAPYSALAGRRVTDLVRSVDVMPTVLDLLGIPDPEPLEGRTLAPLMAGRQPEANLEAFAESLYPLHHFGWSDLRSLRAGRYKYIAAPEPELYDLEQDPGELRNLYGERQALGDRMAARLLEIERGLEAVEATGANPEIDPDARSRLAALGYVGTFVATAPVDEQRTGLADPKEKIGLFNKIVEARELSSNKRQPYGAPPTPGGRSDETIAVLNAVVAEDPEVIDAWFMLGNEYTALGRLDEAVAHYQRALALKPDYDIAVINMANAYRKMGRDEEAAVGYERFLQLDPKNAQVRFELGRLLADHDRLEAAEKEIRRALDLEPEMAAAQSVLGVIQFKRGDAAGGLRTIRRALEIKPDVRLAHFNMALIHEAQGDLSSAITEYRREIDLHADAYKAWFNLGKLYEQVGDRPRQLEAYTKAVETNPYFAEGHLFLAKLYLDLEQRFDEAIALARRGLELAPRSEYAPLAHYILADIYSRQGRSAAAAREAAAGQRLEAALAGRRTGG